MKDIYNFFPLTLESAYALYEELGYTIHKLNGCTNENMNGIKLEKED